MIRYFSLFTGVGGFEIGIENAYENKVNREYLSERRASGSDSGPIGDSTDVLNRETRGDSEHSTCVGFSEIDKHASAVLKYRFPNVHNYGNIKTIDWAAVPDFDLLVGGSPCQDLSIAGKRAGLEGGRSGLFYEYLRALEEKKPKHFIWENVKGALSSNGGRDFAAILLAFSEAGYFLTWQVLNAKDFGVPQNRERVFVVGTRGEAGREVFFEREADGTHQESANCIDANYHKEWLDHGQRTMIGLRPYGNSQDQKVNPLDGPSQTLSAGHFNQPKIAYCIRTGGTKSPHGSKQNWDSYELDGRIRRLTPKECERLMSWPDDWTRYGDYGNGPKEISDTQRYKMCGNGVVSKVVEEIVRNLFC